MHRITSFGLICVGVFGVALGAWPLLQYLYAEAFVAVGNQLVARTGPLEATYARAKAGGSTHDVELHIVHKEFKLQKSIFISSNRHGYLPTACVAGLVLATPLPLRRRFFALVWGTALVNAYAAIKLAAFPYVFSPHAPGSPPGALSEGIGKALWVVSATSAGWTIVPILIWLALCGSPIPQFSRRRAVTSECPPLAHGQD